MSAAPVQLLLVDVDRERAWALVESLTIGRASDNTIVIEDPRVAPRHALIESRDGALCVKDLGSRDGTFVRGQRIHSEVSLVEGDEIVVGVECFRISRAAHVDERELSKLRACVALSRCQGLEFDVGRVLTLMLAALGEVLEIDRGAVVLLDTAKDARAETTPESWRRTTWTRNNDPVPTLSQTMIREALRSKGVVVNDVLVEPKFARSKSLAAQGILSAACLPLRYGGEDLGVLYIDSRRSRAAFAQSDLDLLSGVAAQAALVVKNALLREALVERTRVAEEANRHKTQFLRNMSHELRTPLNGIVGFAELLESGAAGSLAELQREFVGDILRASRHLMVLITELLDLSSVESGHLTLIPAPLDLRRIIEEICRSVAPLAQAGNVVVDAYIDETIGTVVADPTRLRQVIYNFMSNAIKFTPRGGRVAVRALPEGPSEFRIEVEDSGIGIHRDDLPRVFVDTLRLEPSHKFSGVGIGLVLTRRIVEAHGGRVGVQSVRDRGSVFHAVFPRSKTALT